MLPCMLPILYFMSTIDTAKDGLRIFQGCSTQFTLYTTSAYNIMILRSRLLIINQTYFNLIRNPSLGRRTPAADDFLACLCTQCKNNNNLSIDFTSFRNAFTYIWYYDAWSLRVCMNEIIQMNVCRNEHINVIIEINILL